MILKLTPESDLLPALTLLHVKYIHFTTPNELKVGMGINPKQFYQLDEWMEQTRDRLTIHEVGRMMPYYTMDIAGTRYTKIIPTQIRVNPDNTMIVTLSAGNYEEI